MFLLRLWFPDEYLHLDAVPTLIREWEILPDIDALKIAELIFSGTIAQYTQKKLKNSDALAYDKCVNKMGEDQWAQNSSEEVDALRNSLEYSIKRKCSYF